MQIFLAAPRDADNYREAAKRVAERLNRQHDAKLGSDAFLEVVDWSAHLVPLQGLPESAIVDEIEVGEHDVFVGIAWLGFDQQPADGDGAALSTERNFEIAFNFWRRERGEQCFLCRCMRLPDKLTDIDGKAFHRVNQYFSRFSLDAANPVSYYEFDTATDLEEHLASQLSAIVQPAAEEAAKPAPPAPAAAVKPAPKAVPAAAAEPEVGGAEFERKMVVGQAYEVSFLSIEIVETEPITQARAKRPRDVEVLFRSFQRLVAGTAASYGGEPFAWNERGGLILFWRSRSYDHALMTGLKVLHNLPVFNLDPAQNPLAVSVKMRAAAHDAVIIFRLPISQITSPDLDFLIELQQNHTEPAEISITRRLLERIDNRLKPHFKYQGRFKNEPVYVCKLPSSDKVPSKSTLDDFNKRLHQQVSLVREVLAAAPETLDISALDSMSTAVDEIYSILNKFCMAFSNIDSEWPAEFFSELASATGELTRQEADIWRSLRKGYVSGSFSAGKSRKLEAIVRSASRRRSRSVVILSKLIQRCRQLAGAGEAGLEPPTLETEPATEDLGKKVDAFVRADNLDDEITLTDLLLNAKADFLQYLATATADERHRQLIDKLWKTADLVLLDDLYSIRGRQRADDGKVFDVLVAAPVADRRFDIVRALLELEEQPSQPRIEAAFAEAGLEARDADLQTVWRCLVLGHPKIEIRNFVAFQLSQDSIWQAISHPSIPIASIYSIGERVNKQENEDAKKIYFDCIRARLEAAVESFQTRDEVQMLTKIILLLLDFSFLVETGYFERFDDILGKFLDRANQAGLKVDYFESLRKTLEEARKKSGDKGQSKPPAGLNKLPLILQRRLAGESRYVYWFVSHPDPRIACETLRHVGLMNVERVLRLREVNKNVFTALLRKPELFTRPQAIVAALNHPKCDQNFAGRHIPSLGRTRSGINELQKIANNPSANPMVRAAAKRAAGSAQAAR
jgi:hypothetical protein